MNRALLLLLISIVSLTGCHSHAGNSESDAAKPSIPSPEADVSSTANVSHSPVTKDDGRPVIVAFGDSLTAGYGTNPGESYPDDLQRDLDAQGFRDHVVNQGISGDTTKDGVERLPRVLALHPQIVIVAFGGNDGLRGLPIASTRENLTIIVSALQKAGVKVILGGITLPPNYGPDYIQQFNDTYTLLAKQFHAPLLPFLLKGVFGVPGGMQDDGMHATASGNVTVAKNILPLVVPLLKKR